MNAGPEKKLVPKKKAPATKKPSAILKSKRRSIASAVKKRTTTERKQIVDPDQQIEELRAQLRKLLNIRGETNDSSLLNDSTKSAAELGSLDCLADVRAVQSE